MEQFGRRQLRIGILLDDFIVPAWFYAMIEKINAGGYARFVVVVKKKPIASPQKSLASKLKANYHHTCYIAYRKFEDRFFRPEPFAFEKKDISVLFSHVPVLEVIPIQKKFSDYFQPEDIQKIMEYDVDVFIRNGFRILRGDILKTARHGIWSYHHGDNYVNRGGPAGVWEAIEGWRELGSVLQILSEKLDGGDVLYRSWSQRKVILINEGINNMYWKTLSFMPRKLKELHDKGGETFRRDTEKENQALSFYSNRLYTTPSNREFITRISKRIWNKTKLKFRSLFFFEQWILLFAFNKSADISTTLYKFKRITPPKDRFWADPCVIRKNDRYYIFLEELVYKQNNGKAHIAVLEMDDKGNYGKPEIVLKRDYHLSYPFIFEYKNELYMVPESMDKKTIELYKCTSFPQTWEFVMNLKENINAVDTTIFEKDGKVWMFTNIKENEGASNFDELFLFYADDLLTKNWKAHPKNPIVSDIKSARPAGPLFYRNKKLYRPSQDCSHRYGYATILNEVLVLNEQEYSEYPVTSIQPNWSKDLVATHSLCHTHKLTVVDACIKRRKY